MTQTDDVRARLMAGETPAEVVKSGVARSLVYNVYNLLIAQGLLEDNTNGAVSTKLNKIAKQYAPVDDDDEPQVRQPFIVKRSTPSATGKSANVIDFGSVNPPSDAVSAVRGALGMAVVPNVLRMPMPELLYTAMVTSISEFGWQPMAPQDFIDTVIYQWLEACDIIVRPITRKSELQKLVDGYNNQKIDENNPALKKYIADNKLIPYDQVKGMIELAIADALKKYNVSGNGKDGNGNGKNGEHAEQVISVIPPKDIVLPVDKQQEEQHKVELRKIIDDMKHDTKPDDIKIEIPPRVIPKHEEPNIELPVSQVVEKILKPSPVATTLVQDIHSYEKYQPNDLIAGIPNKYNWMVDRLKSNGIITIGQLITRTRDEIEKMPGLGNLMADKIQAWLIGIGYTLKVNTEVDINKEKIDDSARSGESDGSQDRIEPEGGIEQGKDEGGTNISGTGGDGSPAI